MYAFDQEGRTLNISARAHPQPFWLGPLQGAQAALMIGLVAKLPWC
jgi:hypothetical protein